MASTDLVGPLEWWTLNKDLMVLCMLVAFVSSAIAIFSSKLRGSSVITSLLSAFLFVNLGVPFLAIRYKWPWTDLMLVAAVIGFGSLGLSWTAMRISNSILRRLEAQAATGTIAGMAPLPPAPPAVQEPKP